MASRPNDVLVCGSCGDPRCVAGELLCEDHKSAGIVTFGVWTRRQEIQEAASAVVGSLVFDAAAALDKDTGSP